MEKTQHLLKYHRFSTTVPTYAYISNPFNSIHFYWNWCLVVHLCRTHYVFYAPSKMFINKSNIYATYYQRSVTEETKIEINRLNLFFLTLYVGLPNVEINISLDSSS